ncbi:MAG: alkaline phosphatase [Arenimonas sp.]
MPRAATLAMCAAATLLAGCLPPQGAGLRNTAVSATADSAIIPIAMPVIQRPRDETGAWWFRSGAATAHARGSDRARARNLILFVGDGMSLTTVAAARILEGQGRGEPGEENALSFERFDHTALSKTYNTDSQTPDSAGTMTAMITGSKTRRGMLSIDPGTPRGACSADREAVLPTLLELAEGAGLATGVVTTTRLTHATPGATYGHVSERNWEADANLSGAARASGCRDLARQFVEFAAGDGIEVALGGGRSKFLPREATDPEYPGQHGERQDGRDLIAEWQARHPDGHFVRDARGLQALDLATTRRVFGLFEPSHMRYEHDRNADPAGEPGLAQMTRAAITVLARDPDGFVLVVEGGRIDHAHHAGNAFRALTETIAMADAVRVADELTRDDDTLILVTADHSHTLSFVGYPMRGNAILGKVVGAAGEDKRTGTLALDRLGLPYTTLNYSNGPGYTGASDSQPAGPKRFDHYFRQSTPATGRPDLTHVDTTAPDYLQESLYPLASESHGGEDVGIWAHGAGADAVRGTVEQNVIFHFLLQASPRLRAYACKHGACEQGVPVLPPRRARP